MRGVLDIEHTHTHTYYQTREVQVPLLLITSAGSKGGSLLLVNRLTASTTFEQEFFCRRIGGRVAFPLSLIPSVTPSPVLIHGTSPPLC